MANLRKSTIGMMIISLIDFAVGIAAIFASTYAVKVLGSIASGLTVCKAVQVCVKSKKKGIEFATRVAAKSIPVITHTIKQIKEKGTMKDFFKKIGSNLKNNKVTAVVVVFIALLCAGGGYAVNFIAEQVTFIPEPYNIVIAVGMAVVIFAILAIAVIYLGHDNKFYAIIRKAVKVIGDDQAAEALDELKTKVIEQQEEEAKRKAEDDEIYAQICAEEAAREKALRDQKIAEWRATHAVKTETPIDDDVDDEC